MASRFITPFFDVGNGITPSDGAKLFFFITGTSTPKDTFTDEALIIANTNPVIADSDGLFSDIWMADGARYKVQLKDKNDVQQWESDPVIGGGSSESAREPFPTVAAMVASTELSVGEIVDTAGYLSKGDGGDNRYEIVAAATGTDDGGSFIDLATHQAKGLFPDTGRGISIKQFGGVADGLDGTPTDSTIPVNNAITFASTVREIDLDGMYATSGSALTRAVNSGITIIGNKAPSDIAQTNDTPGFSAFGNQAHILKIGEDAGTFEGGSLENICLHGRDKTISTAGFNPERWSQGNMRNVVVTNCKGRGVLTRKWEDMDVYNFRVLKCGTVAGEEGGLIFSSTPDLATNVLKFFGGRFEWIDGPMVGLNVADVNSAVSHVTFIGTKFEVGTQDGYGTTRAANSVWEFQPNLQSRTQNIRFIDCWLAQASECQEILHLGLSSDVLVDGLKMSSADGGPIKLYTMDEGGGTDARNFIWRNTSIINTAADWTLFTVDYSANCLNPMTMEEPVEYQSNGPKLVNDKWYIDANTIGLDGKMQTDPARTTDPALTTGGNVCREEGSNTDTLAVLSSTRDYTGTALRGLSKQQFNGIIKISARIKRTGFAAPANIEVRAGGAFLVQFTVDNSSWEWHDVYINLRDLALSDEIVLTNSASNNAAHFVFVDVVIYTLVDEFFDSAIPVSGTFKVGERVWFTAPASAAPPGAICVTAGTPGTWANMANLA